MFYKQSIIALVSAFCSFSSADLIQNINCKSNAGDFSASIHSYGNAVDYSDNHVGQLYMTGAEDSINIPGAISSLHRSHSVTQKNVKVVFQSKNIVIIPLFEQISAGTYEQNLSLKINLKSAKGNYKLHQVEPSAKRNKDIDLQLFECKLDVVNT